MRLTLKFSACRALRIGLRRAGSVLFPIMKHKKVRKEEIRTSILIFGTFYLVIAILITVAILKG